MIRKYEIQFFLLSTKKNPNTGFLFDHYLF